MKITVCKGCKQVMPAIDDKGKPACVTCHGISSDNSIPEEVDMPEELHCSCGSVAKWENNGFTVTLGVNGGWNCTTGKVTTGLSLGDIPFIDTKEKSFYCGCMGWD